MVTGTMNEKWWQWGLEVHGLVNYHYYSVVDEVEAKNGQRYVELRNPWGVRSDFRPGAGPIFELKLETYQRSFPELVVN